MYLLIALLLAMIANATWKRYTLGIDGWLRENLWWWWDTDPKTGKLIFKNTIVYNLASLSRLLCFTWFFSRIGYSFKTLNKIIPWLFLVMVFINFIWFENVKDFSSRQLTVEAALLLFYSLVYFYKTTMDDSLSSPMAQSHFWVAAGLALYTAVNFFIFLFYTYLMSEFIRYSQEIWNVHNISYVVLNLFIGLALYRAK